MTDEVAMTADPLALTITAPAEMPSRVGLYLAVRGAAHAASEAGEVTAASILRLTALAVARGAGQVDLPAATLEDLAAVVTALEPTPVLRAVVEAIANSSRVSAASVWANLFRLTDAVRFGRATLKVAG